MTISKQDIQKQNYFFEAEQSFESGIEEEIIELFTSSGKANPHDIDGLVDKISQNFLSINDANTDIEIDSLLGSFSNSKIPVKPANIKTYLKYLTNNVIDHSIHTSSPRFIGHMTSALPSFVLPLAKLMTAMNQNAVKIETAKSLSFCEREALAMMHRLIYNFSDNFYAQHIQNSQSTLGILLSGGTTANITALWCARNNSLGAKDGFGGVEEEGLTAALDFYGYKGAVIIGSELMHFSFDKAADLMGIGIQGLIRIPTNSNNQVDIQALREAVVKCHDQKLLIIGIIGVAGTTDSGGVDSIAEIAEIAQAAKVHFHVDAAWGGPLIFSEQHRHKLAGIERADSVTIDGHKQMYLPMGIGMVFFRDPDLAKAIEKQAAYTMRKGSFDLGKRALEGSRPGMALFLHAGLNLIGLKGYEFLIDEGIRKTQYMADKIFTMPEFELLAKPDTNLLIYRYIPESLRELVVKNNLTEIDNQLINQFNEKIQKIQRQSGRTFISRTTKTTICFDREIPIIALRAVIANPLTTKEDIDAVLSDQIQIAAEVSTVIS
ncbi:pyridoxal-dependent aspartate 1-decarboxylase PanP [Nostoc sp. 'Peltigera membranacea cyanobiont' N6]|uniref:pyridoxal-dependent aspartate 1-decarboxylase PanP n=1 Tax=Nostoc sp. 'Peltigera membranacea cyanobiont' N6 TaxID=1261031 RepID=UPI000CF33EFE|nr:putative pyridoxal-dependent aspartate 1-decarboxylase [Nostoc sp. 'Peltigera membranacea cyanobiont' N6]AVH67259.1 pyridoxal-dependent decarboxylase [Nostoc sp. 'Peltigera membranacea cyanobiont' N6]